jgi:hypothetical protein
MAERQRWKCLEDDDKDCGDLRQRSAKKQTEEHVVGNQTATLVEFTANSAATTRARNPCRYGARKCRYGARGCRYRASMSMPKSVDDMVNAVAVTPDSRRVVSASIDGALKMWELESDSTITTFSCDCTLANDWTSLRVTNPADSTSLHSKLRDDVAALRCTRVSTASTARLLRRIRKN